MDFSKRYFKQVATIVAQIDLEAIAPIVAKLIALRTPGGRLFILGIGGSAANASYAVNDFRSSATSKHMRPPVSELTARTSDEGWTTVFATWFRTSRADLDDAVLVLSVGGGERNVSANFVEALDEARRRGLTDAELVTPYSEAFQAVVWHCLVSHPQLKENSTNGDADRLARWCHGGGKKT